MISNKENTKELLLNIKDLLNSKDAISKARKSLDNLVDAIPTPLYYIEELSEIEESLKKLENTFLRISLFLQTLERFLYKMKNTTREYKVIGVEDIDNYEGWSVVSNLANDCLLLVRVIEEQEPPYSHNKDGNPPCKELLRDLLEKKWDKE